MVWFHVYRSKRRKDEVGGVWFADSHFITVRQINFLKTTNQNPINMQFVIAIHLALRAIPCRTIAPTSKSTYGSILACTDHWSSFTSTNHSCSITVNDHGTSSFRYYSNQHGNLRTHKMYFKFSVIHHPSHAPITAACWQASTTAVPPIRAHTTAAPSNITCAFSQQQVQSSEFRVPSILLQMIDVLWTHHHPPHKNALI